VPPRHRRLRAALVPLALAAATPAHAACTVDVVPLHFGTVRLDSITWSRGRVGVSCDVAATVEVALSPGAGSYAMRAMVGPRGARLHYQIYTDQRTYRVWGDGSGGSATVTASVPAGGRIELTLHGMVPAQVGVPEGSYSDSLTVTLIF